jgi:mono/diheme cytochrome c family protein
VILRRPACAGDAGLAPRPRKAAAAGLLALLAAMPAFAQDQDEIERGHRLFTSRCVVCHGPNADGQGQLSKMLNPPPANLRASTLDAAARNAIIRHGGASVGRSSAMPRWEAELSEPELRGVIAYVASIAPKKGGRP